MQPGPRARRWTRREVIALGAHAVAGTALIGCSRLGPDAGVSEAFADADVSDVATEPAFVAPDAWLAGREERVLLPGAPWAATLHVTHSGRPGPVVLVLGGTHGDEPGAWRAADEVAGWTPLVGSLLVLPRANVLAIEAGERALPELGDPNRLYPGDAMAELPMARMVHAILEVAREFRVRTLYDMHESWQFFREREEDGDASLGQTVSAGVGPESPASARALVGRANRLIGAGRERLVARREEPPRSEVPTNSLGAGRFVEGLTTLLVEMGQEGQPEWRRTELHLLVARTFLQSRRML